jgi:hypothetical protein
MPIAHRTAPNPASFGTVVLTRTTGATTRVRQTTIAKVISAIQKNPGLTARDISMHTQATPDQINWILDCHPEGQKLARSGKIARPTRGPLPLWAQQIDPSIIPDPPNDKALIVAAQNGIAPLDSSITLPFARQEGDAAREKVARLVRFSGGSSPSRAKRANQIIEMSVSLLALTLQESVEQFQDLKEEAIALQEELVSTEGRADKAEDRASTMRELVETYRKHIQTLEQQAAMHSARAKLLEDQIKERPSEE